MADSQSQSSDVFEMDQLVRLIDLMKEHDLIEVDLQQGDQKIRLARAAATSPVPLAVAPAAAVAAPAATDSDSPSPEDDPNIVTICSPMVGTFYSKANPDAEPYVKIGDSVDADTTICIIEAMKVFNEIPAEVRGRIVAVLVDNEEPVDHGRPLFKVDTSL
jgi:acetyl-CoA carboxylase biotin carboxyl carrier protein